jgi:hypothetical protein
MLVLNKWIIRVAILSITVALLFFLSNYCYANNKDMRSKVPRISCKQALYLLNASKIYLIDVDEKKGTPVVGAYHIPKSKLSNVKLPFNKKSPLVLF